MEKTKVDKPNSNRGLGCIGLFIFGIVAILASFYFVRPWITGYMSWESLEKTAPQLVPTAEALLERPVADDTEFSLDLSHVNEGYPLCVNFNPIVGGPYDWDELYGYSLFYIDGIEVRQGIYSLLMESTFGLRFCAYGHIESGLHLIEFHVKNSSGELRDVQQWAIEID